MDQNTKTCTACGMTLAVACFYFRNDRGGRYLSQCKRCLAGLRARQYQIDAERIKATARAWQEKNRLRVRENVRAYDLAHPEARKNRKHRRRSLEKSRYCPPPAVAARLDYFGHKCWMCGNPATTIDHVKPLSKGGLHIPANLRPACTTCNQRKSSRWYGTSQLNLFIAA